jgi:hypothetical protein
MMKNTMEDIVSYLYHLSIKRAIYLTCKEFLHIDLRKHKQCNGIIGKDVNG